MLLRVGWVCTQSTVRTRPLSCLVSSIRACRNMAPSAANSSSVVGKRPRRAHEDENEDVTSSSSASSPLSSVESNPTHVNAAAEHRASHVRSSGSRSVPAAASAVSTDVASTNGTRPAAQVLRSCTECGRRKIRCDKQRPCSACVHRGEPDRCHSGTYKRLRTDRYVSALRLRLCSRFQAMEALTAHLVDRVRCGMSSGSRTPPLNSSTNCSTECSSLNRS